MCVTGNHSKSHQSVGQMWGTRGAKCMAKQNAKKATKFQGVRSRQHSTRKHGAVKKDECFFIRQRVDGKVVEERVGWLSEGATAEKAFILLTELKENARNGVGPRTLRELREANQQAAAEAEEEKRLERARNVSFKQYFNEQYLPEASQRKKQKTLSVEIGHLRDWLDPVFGDKPMKDISRADLEQIKVNLLDMGRSSRTVQHVLAVFRLIWNHAKKRQVVETECPTALIDLPKVNNARSRFLTPEEAAKLLEAVKELDIDAWELTLAALYTGARLGELTALEWSGVDLANETIRFLHTKTDKPRLVPLAGPLREVLEGKQRGTPADLVFTNRAGKFWKEAPWAFKKAVDDLGLNEGRTDRRDRIVFHSLRHTAASMMLSAGCDMRSLQSLFGWSTIQMAGRYAHALDETKVKAVGMLESALKVG